MKEKIFENNQFDPFVYFHKFEGSWENDYKFSEEYYSLEGEPVTIAPEFEGDTNGVLYDKNNEIVHDLPMDNNGNYLPVILKTVGGKYFEFCPIFPQIVEKYERNKKNSQKSLVRKEINPDQNKQVLVPKQKRQGNAKSFKRNRNKKRIGHRRMEDIYYHEEQMTLEKVRDREKEHFKSSENVYVEVNVNNETLSLALIGHVNTGKSVLAGRLLCTYKNISKEALLKLETESKENKHKNKELAYLIDMIPSEKVKGITIEYSRDHFERNNRIYHLIDTPGHVDYLPSMAVGTQQADCAVLVVSAHQGDFESGIMKGQTREHALIAKALGVTQVICVVTKMDSVDWDRERFLMIEANLNQLLIREIGFTTISVVPINPVLNENIDAPLSIQTNAGSSGSATSEISSIHLGSWYTGKTFNEMLDCIPIPQRNPDGPIRMTVIDMQNERNDTFLGRIESGTIVDNLWVTIMPSRYQFQIASIYNLKNERVFYASVGEAVMVSWKNADGLVVSQGDVVCDTEDLCPVAVEFQAEISVQDMTVSQVAVISPGFSCMMHLHTCVCEVEIKEVYARINPEKRDQLFRSTFLKAKESGIVIIQIKRHSVCLEKFQTFPRLGTFILRNKEKTIGVGKISKIKPLD